MKDKWIDKLEMNERYDERYDFIDYRLIQEAARLEHEEWAKFDYDPEVNYDEVDKDE